jgi:hypothetical protein
MSIPANAYARHLSPAEVQEYETHVTVEATFELEFEGAVQLQPGQNVADLVDEDTRAWVQQILKDATDRLRKPNVPTMKTPAYDVKAIHFEQIHDSRTRLGDRG